MYEDKYTQKQKEALKQLNTEEQIKRGQFYISKYNQLKAEMETRTEQWNELERLYQCEREYIPGAPNSFMPLIAPAVNGQVSSMVEQNITASARGKGLSDQNFARTAQLSMNLTLKENKIKSRIKIGAKRYVLFGMGCFAVDWDPDYQGGLGISRIRTPQITKVFVDGKIKDILDFQNTDYVIEEIGYMSILWARSEYGDEKANFIAMANNNHDFDNEETSEDEKDSFMLLRVWTRNNPNRELEMLEMDGNGLILYDSSMDKNIGGAFYKYVDNKYPYSFFGLYQEEGNFYRFGDGKLLKCMQETLNKLYDEVITACKYSSQGKPLIDPAGECDPNDFDNSTDPVIVRKPNETVRVLQGSGINPVVERLIQNLLQQAQRVTRFSDLMVGNTTGEKLTATQAGIQTQQGNVGISDKKSDISTALSEILEYALGIEMEMRDSGQMMRVSEDKDEFEWVDVRELARVPVMVPVDEKYRKKWRKSHPKTPMKEMPKFMAYVPEKDIESDGEIVARAGETQTKRIALDIDVSIGEGLPTSKVAMYNIILSLAQLQLPDETGRARPLMSYEQVRKMIEDIVGIPLDDAMSEAQAYQAQQNPQAQKPLNVNETIPGATLNGNVIGGAA